MTSEREHHRPHDETPANAQSPLSNEYDLEPPHVTAPVSPDSPAGHRDRSVAPPTSPAASSTGGTISPDDARCVECSYQLRGLSADGTCPECGTPVFRSIQGNLLKFSSASYLAMLHRGVFIVLASIIAHLLLIFGSIAWLAAMAVITGGGTPVAFLMVIMELSVLAAGLAYLVGWWMFSAPDPAIIGVNTGTTARQVVRVTLVINAATTLASSVLEIAAVGSPELELMAAIVAIVGLIAWAVQFFASMKYLQWLAPRLPNHNVLARAKLLMWLGPLLYTVGALACGIGPLIALVLYWNLLDWVRRDIKRIRYEHQRLWGSPHMNAGGSAA